MSSSDEEMSQRGVVLTAPRCSTQRGAVGCSMSRRNLELIVEAIRHLEGERISDLAVRCDDTSVMHDVYAAHSEESERDSSGSDHEEPLRCSKPASAVSQMVTSSATTPNCFVATNATAVSFPFLPLEVALLQSPYTSIVTTAVETSWFAPKWWCGPRVPRMCFVISLKEIVARRTRGLVHFLETRRELSIPSDWWCKIFLRSSTGGQGYGSCCGLAMTCLNGWSGWATGRISSAGMRQLTSVEKDERHCCCGTCSWQRWKNLSMAWNVTNYKVPCIYIYISRSHVWIIYLFCYKAHFTPLLSPPPTSS